MSQSFLQLIVFILIPLLITVFCIIAISFVIRKQRMRINDVSAALAEASNPSTNEINRVNPIRQLVQNGVKTLRLIGMVSGIFVASIIPSVFCRQVVAMQGVTWFDIETRSVYWASVLMRLESTVGSVLFATVNQLIYYYVEKVFYYELKAKFKLTPTETNEIV